MWNEERVEKELRKAGYQRNGATGWYVHPDTNHTIKMYDWVGGRELWQDIGEAEELPLPPTVTNSKRGDWWQISLIESLEGDRSIRFDRLPLVVSEEVASEIAVTIMELLDGEG